MSGLVFKDLMILRKQGKAYLLILGVYAALALAGVFDYSIISSMMVVLLMMMPMATFSYDDLARWDKYAASMPVGRAGIVKSKYITTIVITGGAAVLCLAVNIIITAVGLDEMSFGVLSLALVGCLDIGLLINAVVLPLMFKYGAEKARGMTMAVLLVIFILVFGVSALLGEIGLEKLSERAIVFSPLLMALAAVGSMLLSYRIALRIYTKKDL